MICTLYILYRYAVAALAEYRPLVLQLGEEEVCSAAVASLTRLDSVLSGIALYRIWSKFILFIHTCRKYTIMLSLNMIYIPTLISLCITNSTSISFCRFSARADLVQWTALAIANLSTEIKLSTAFGEANCCTVLIHVSYIYVFI